MSTPTDRTAESSRQPTSDRRQQLQEAVGDRYRIEGAIGEGGMATVFLAEDLKHNRKVAVKVLHETLAHTIGIRRFLQEIDVIARLQHPHLLTLIDSGEVGGLPYYVMPFVESQSLRELIVREKRLPIDRAVTIAREVADGLQFAHERGIIHRDIKPSNILMSGGHAVVADFGIATALNNAAVGRLTETGISMGSPTYMSPEQAAAERDLDARTDVYSLGCVLYEMLTGEPPIDSASMQQAVTRKLTGQYRPARSLRPDISAELETAVHRALATNREDRFPSALTFAAAIERAAGLTRKRLSRSALLMRGAVVGAMVAAAGLWLRHERQQLWASERVADIDRFAKNGEFASAFDLDTKVRPILSDDSTLRRIRPIYTDFVRIVTLPAGASVSRQRVGQSNGQWEKVGTTPLDSVPVPKYGRDVAYQFRIEHAGFNTVDLLPNVFANWSGFAPLDTLRLDAAGTHLGMIRIPGWRGSDVIHGRPGRADSITYADYYIGVNEVTNAEFKRFVDEGGYAKQEYWTEPFILSGATLSFTEAMQRLRDRSGLPGPATWSNGSFPEGQADYPVGGVSYYEAAAYARFAGRQLPTSAHWFRAARRFQREAAWISSPTSNLNGTGPRPVGQGVINSYGLHDVEGNVREWCLNPVDSGRLTRGGAWTDDQFFTGHLIPKPDFDRDPTNGFRLVALSDADTTIAHLTGRIARPPIRDYTKVHPVGDAEFRIFSRLFSYQQKPLEARTDTSGSTETWRWEKVSFSAAYGGERMAAYIFLPKELKPPYQPIVLWLGSNMLTERHFNPRTWSLEHSLSFFPRSGRALILPLFKGSYERDDSAFSITRSTLDSTIEYRDLATMWVKDFRRTIDYLQTRPDMSSELGFFGASWGSEMAPIPLAVEPRVRAAVIYIGGFWPGGGVPYPEIDKVNYLPRVRIPTLMLNGRYDIVFPYQETQVPFFNLLGTPAADKKHVLDPSSHSIAQADLVRETVAWFDKYLSHKH